MSLSIFLHTKSPKVEIIRWFKDEKFSLLWASGPIVEMSAQEFRRNGFKWVRKHFSDFKKIRVSESKVVNPFLRRTVKSVMDDSDLIDIRVDDNTWKLRPGVVRRNTFPQGFELLEKETIRTIPANCSATSFWKAFDEVLELSHSFWV